MSVFRKSKKEEIKKDPNERDSLVSIRTGEKTYWGFTVLYAHVEETITMVDFTNGIKHFHCLIEIKKRKEEIIILKKEIMISDVEQITYFSCVWA